MQVGILGCINMNDIDTNYIPGPEDIYILDVPEVSRINRMVAYENPATGDHQIVAIAELRYRDSTINPNYLFSEHKIVSCNGSDITNSIANGNPFPYEVFAGDIGILYDIVQTDQFVATIGSYPALGVDNIAIRRCSKINVNANELSTLIYYPSQVELESLSRFHACEMEGDNIAVAYMAPKEDAYCTRIRYINIDTWEMFNSQEYALETKAEPIELTYLPASRSVVLLQECGSSNCHISFNGLFPDIYTTYIYNRLFHSSLGWESISRLTDGCYVASGGNYCFLKCGIDPDANSQCLFLKKVDRFS